MTTSAAPGEGITYLEVPIAITGCIIYIFVAIAIHHYKETYHHMPWIHESSVACLIGVLMGGIILYATGVTVVFDNNLFFYMVLPPVIFSAGYSLKRKNFFKYMDLIAFFGIVGTVMNFALIAAGAYAYGRLFGNDTWFRVSWNEALIFSAVLTGSDEVSARSIVRIKDFPRMGALIFGEGVVNDAMSIVLFKTFLPLYNSEHETISVQQSLTYPAPSTLSVIQSIIVQLVCSMLIGVTCGLLHARLMRTLPMIKHFPIYQTALVMLFGYLSYCAAEATGISGILTVFIAAVTLAHYSWYNLSSSAQITTRLSFAAISEVAEGFAFSYVGLSLWVYDEGDMNVAFAVYMLIVVLLARVITILGLFKVCSLCFKSFRVPLSEQLGFTLGGVVRGCLCWAQILQVQHSPVLIKATLLIVMTTSLGCGVLLPMLLPMLTPAPMEDGNKIESYQEQDSEPNSPVIGNGGANNKVPFPKNNRNSSNGASRSLLRTPERERSDRTQEIENHNGGSGALSINTMVSPGQANPPNSTDREYNFEYEPFSADFPHSQSKASDCVGRSPHSTLSHDVKHSSSVQNMSSGDIHNNSHNSHGGVNSSHRRRHSGSYVNNSTTPQISYVNNPLSSPYPITMLSPDPLDDLRSNEELIQLISVHNHTSSVNGVHKQPSLSKALFWQWIRFDETFMKPFFGGSDRRYRLLQERGRQLNELEASQQEQANRNSSVGSIASLSSIHTATSGDASLLGIAGASNKKSTKSYGSIQSSEGSDKSNASTVQTSSAVHTHLPPAHRNSTSSAVNSTTHSTRTSQGTQSHQSHQSHPSSHTMLPFSSPVDSFWSPGGREYVLEEDREDEMELEKLAEEICLLDRDEDDRDG
eukprot:gene8195-9754_t